MDDQPYRVLTSTENQPAGRTVPLAIPTPEAAKPTADQQRWVLAGGCLRPARAPPPPTRCPRAPAGFGAPPARVRVRVGRALAQPWYGSALTSVTFMVLPLGSVYSRVSPTLASISAPPSGEFGE